MSDEKMKEEPTRVLPGSVALLADLPNIVTAVKGSFGARENPDWRRLINVAVGQACHRRTVAFVTTARVGGDRSDTARLVVRLGFQEAVACEGDVDEFLIKRALGFRIHGYLPETMVVASGDSDFLPIYDENKRRGVRNHVMAVPGSLATVVERLVDGITLLNEDFLWRPRAA